MAALVIAWLAVILLAFYGYFWRYIQTFDHRGLYPQGQVAHPPFITLVEQNIQLSGLNQLDTVVLHLLDPECFCTVYSGNTVDKLTQDTTSDKLRHVVLVPPGKTNALHQLLPVLGTAEVIELDVSTYMASKELVPATPAALVYNKKEGTVSYLGPHSSGVVCGKGTGFVDLVLNNLQHGFDPLLYELEQKGCFCSWGD